MDSQKIGIGSVTLRIIVALFLGLVALILSSIVVASTDNTNLMHAGMFVSSLILILILSKGKISEYGFRIGENLRLKQTIIVGLIAGFIITSTTLYLPINPPPGTEDFSFIQVVILVWIFASIAEEVLSRGLVQSYLSPLRVFAFSIFGFRISLPVLFAALFFGAMHLPLLMTGLDSFSVFSIVISAFIMGIIAGYYREKTQSLIPAIIIHMLFNITGTIIGFIKDFI
ncbi:MAG: CPBP family intramembrane glutamic endopeptidase [Candidatus Zixiibacteriota bacterium]